MFTCMRLGRCLSCIAAMAMMASPLVAAERDNERAKAEQVFDVTISKQGKLTGQVLSNSGQPRVKTTVVAMAKDQVIAKTQTDVRGVFQLPVNKPGVYQIALADRSFTVRAWNADLAPPATRDALLCVTQDGPTVRGQLGNDLRCLLTNPIFIGLGVAAAVAVPIVIDEVDDDDELPAAS